MRSARRVSFRAALFVAGALLASCSGGGSSLPTAQTNSQQTSHSIQTQSVAAVSTDCTAAPVKGIRATVTSLQMNAGGVTTFTVCTQYFGKFTITNNTNPSAATATLTPSQPVDDVIYTATVTVTAGNTAGTTYITISDKKGNSVTVKVTVAVPTGIITFSPPSPENFGAGYKTVDVTISEGGYSGGFSITSCSGTGDPPPFGCMMIPKPLSNGVAFCSNGSSGNQNRMGMEIDSSTPDTLNTVTDPVGTAAALSCTATVSDTLGHHADYTITAPAQ